MTRHLYELKHTVSAAVFAQPWRAHLVEGEVMRGDMSQDLAAERTRERNDDDRESPIRARRVKNDSAVGARATLGRAARARARTRAG